VESYFVLQFSYQSESFIYVEHCEDLFALLVCRPVEASDLLSFYGLRCSDSVIEAASLKRHVQALPHVRQSIGS
jgi:hypothetical protein